MGMQGRVSCYSHLTYRISALLNTAWRHRLALLDECSTARNSQVIAVDVTGSTLGSDAQVQNVIPSTQDITLPSLAMLAARARRLHMVQAKACTIAMYTRTVVSAHQGASERLSQPCCTQLLKRPTVHLR